MPFGSFQECRYFLSQISASSLAEQVEFTRLANAALSDLAGNSRFLELNEAANQLISSSQGSENGDSKPSLRWTRWRDDQDRSGVALTLAPTNSRYVLLPDKIDPPVIAFDETFSDKRLLLLPNLETLARSNGSILTYVHRDLLVVSPRPSEDAWRYARLIRMTQAGLVPPFPFFHAVKDDPSHQYVEEGHGGAHWAILAAQKGMDFVLGEMMPPAISFDTISLAGAALCHPLYDVVLSEAPDLRDALPPDACFGAGDPRYHKLQISIRAQKNLENAEGKVVGWCSLTAGGCEGRHADPISGISAATSAGGRPNQEDGYYVAHFRSHDGRDVRVIVGADGLGGAEMGEMASSAALQGAHAGILRAIREQRTPLAGDLFDEAREALEAQILFHEMEKGAFAANGHPPDTVIAVCVVIDGEATIATAGDFMAVLCAKQEDGRVRVLGHTLVDAQNDHVVNNTLRAGRKRLSRAQMPPNSWLIAASDGAMEGLVPSFKMFMSPVYREETTSAFPEQTRFYNLLHVLEHAPEEYAGPALHDAAGGSDVIPGGGKDPHYPALGRIEPERDNWTVVALHWDQFLKGPDLPMPGDYGPLESVYPAYQYVFEESPFALNLPKSLQEIFVGKNLHPEGRPMVILTDDPNLSRAHVRIERVVNGTSKRFFVEKLVGAGRVGILDARDKPIASLSRKHTRHEIQPGYRIRLTNRTFFRFRGD